MQEIESWQDGSWIPNSSLGIPITDAHAMFGIAVFDAMRTYNHTIWRVNDHLDRLTKGIRQSGFIEPPFLEDIKTILQVCMHHNKRFFPASEEYRFMVYASPGDFKIYNDNPQPRLTIFVTPCSNYASRIAPYLDTGVTGVVAHQQQIPHRFVDPRIKQCSRWHYWSADKEAVNANDVAIMLDEFGFVAEAPGANIGVVDQNGTVCMPYGINHLEGITMDSIDNINDSFFRFKELTPYDLIHADSVFFTSTFGTIVPCYKIAWQGKTYELPNKHNVPRQLLDDFGGAVGVDIYNQWKGWYE